MRTTDARASRVTQLTPLVLGQIRTQILAWGKQNYRSFPWRETCDPYRILVAEVLLHRTRAEQVVPYYEELVDRYPDPISLTGASIEALECLLYPLGLRWRVRLLHQMAQEIVYVHGGRIPEDRGALRALPGVSDYIAGAVRCLAFGVPEPVLDTNIVRVLGRLFGLPTTDSSRRSKVFRELMRQLVECEEPRQLLLAILDLAALICRPVRPDCVCCPLREVCCEGKERCKVAAQ